MAPSRVRSRRDPPQASTLPPDLLYDILLRLPGEDLCRLRAVCRPWRTLLSDPFFIAAHAARHPEPLIVAGYEASPRNGLALCDVMDLSGRVVKRVRAGAERDRVMRAHLDLLCVARGGSSMSCQLLNPATGAVHALPEGLAAEHAAHRRQGFVDCWASTAFGLVASTGEYKVLRVVNSFPCYGSHPPMKLYEVCTIDGRNQARWRGKKAPPYDVELEDWNSVVIKHIVYFLIPDYDSKYDDTEHLVASFDLETEKWGASIRGPLLSRLLADYDDGVYDMFMSRSWFDFKIAALGERLVLGCRTPSTASPCYMDLWFLRDYKKGLWVKQHNIEISTLHVRHLVQPLLVLKDGRIANRIRNCAFLKNFNIATNASTDVLEMKHGVVAVGLYGGSLLSLASGTS